MARQIESGCDEKPKKNDLSCKFCGSEKHYMHDFPKLEAEIKKRRKHRNKKKMSVNIAKNEEPSNDEMYVDIDDADLPNELAANILHVNLAEFDQDWYLDIGASASILGEETTLKEQLIDFNKELTITIASGYKLLSTDTSSIVLNFSSPIKENVIYVSGC